MAVNSDYVRERLTAYIYPRAPSDEAQEEAFDNAVNAQVEYESASEDGDALPPGVASFSIGNYSVTAINGQSASYTQQTICPAAWAYLYNAGLIRYALPTARRL